MRLSKDKRLAARKIGGNLFLVSPWDHKLHKCNETATFLLELIDKGLSAVEIEKFLCQEYDVNPRSAKEDTAEFFEKIRGLKLYE